MLLWALCKYRYLEGKVLLRSILEHRPLERRIKAYVGKLNHSKRVVLKMNRKLWYCKQCGYVVFREDHTCLSNM